MGVAPSRTFQPPTVTISTSAALTSSSTTTVTRVACTTGLLRLGWMMITPGWRCCAGWNDMIDMTIPPGAVPVGVRPAASAVGGRAS